MVRNCRQDQILKLSSRTIGDDVPFYEKLGYRVFGTLENHPVGHQHYFMTKKLDSGESLEGSQENSVGTLLDNPRARTLYDLGCHP